VSGNNKNTVRFSARSQKEMDAEVEVASHIERMRNTPHAKGGACTPTCGCGVRRGLGEGGCHMLMAHDHAREPASGTNCKTNRAGQNYPRLCRQRRERVRACDLPVNKDTPGK
jgi:hypothetical protein